MKLSRVFYWLLVAAILLNGLLAVPQMISGIKSRAEAVQRLVQILDIRADKISLSTGLNSSDSTVCYVTTSEDEMSHVISALHGYQRLFIGGGGGKKVPFALTVNFADGSTGHLIFSGRADEQSKAYLERFDYTQINDGSSEVFDKVGLKIPDIGVWAATVMDRNNCR